MQYTFEDEDEDTFVTYRRVDGRLIDGQYSFVTSIDAVEEEECGIIEEVWKLEHRSYIPYSPFTDYEDGEEG